MKYRTGELCPRSGHYAFVGHIEGRGRPNCHPTSDERDIPMHQGDHFPPVKSCQEGAYWTYVRPL
ncbi:MAG: YjzC family protein [Thaumarchaeota archaeon]|nr:YjzC family protein [Nitrososphaerota archaeon]MBI3641075.1 YjzC family protein [Nitrososphaerota archaeon]